MENFKFTLTSGIMILRSVTDTVAEMTLIFETMTTIKLSLTSAKEKRKRTFPFIFQTAAEM
jgi:hypothetical protein